VWSRWTLPPISEPFIDVPLRAFAVSLEGRYKLRPGLYAAARVDHLGFSDITGTAGSQSWEAPLSRVEIGGGYYLQRNLVLKLSYQYNTRDGGRQPTLGLPAAQLVYWF
jgi:predicted porin